MKRIHRHLRYVVALVLLGCHVLAPSPGIAAKARGRALISFYTIGTGNPDLHYVFDSWHEAEITQHTGLESLFPTTYQGTLRRDNNSFLTCFGFGIVSSPKWTCAGRTTISCPYAQGRWSTRTRMSAAIPPAETEVTPWPESR